MKNTSIEQIGCFKLIVDIYNGVTIEQNDLPNTKEEFEINLEFLIEQIKNSRFLIWIYIPKEKASFIETSVQRGFIFHSCSTDYILLVKRLKDKAIIPTAANHTLGVGVVIINDKNELLVIKERKSHIGYKIPGGHVDDGEMISDAALREVFEETGIKIDFNSVISLGHFYPHQFHKSNLYIICKAKPLSLDINIQDTDEIEDAKWVNINEYLNDDNVIAYSKDLIKAAISSKEFKKLENHALSHLEKNIELFF